MPFQSRAQQRYLYAREPEIASRFARETPKGSYSKLPERVRKSGRKSSLLEAWKSGKGRKKKR